MKKSEKVTERDNSAKRLELLWIPKKLNSIHVRKLGIEIQC